MRRQAHGFDRPTFLRMIAAINRCDDASAARIAARLRIPNTDARELAMDEVAAGYLRCETVTHDHRYVVYRLTEKAHGEIGLVAV